MSVDKEALKAELEALTGEVNAALAKRKAWMDEHMPAFARVGIGEEIFDLKTGQKLGVVTRHYRYWGDRDSVHDTSMEVECEYCKYGNVYDNTSRHAGSLWYGSRDDLRRKLSSHLGELDREEAKRTQNAERTSPTGS